jgi:Cd2+/Zn2+-exporting ATPase/Cu+-exporting ATPase
LRPRPSANFFTALVIMLFVLVAEVLEGMTVSQGRHAIHDLIHFLPQMISVRRPDRVREIHVDDLQVGDTVLVNPGGRVPVDGMPRRACAAKLNPAFRATAMAAAPIAT